jgi:NADH-quinone oxidoreductase subunit L
LSFVTVIGATTCFFAATIGCVQTDIKRVIAYSTCSQLGYMFVGLGVGGYSLGIFHLFTHAFFKALLFLGAGAVIDAMHHEQDMMHMGALRTKIPATFWTMLIGTLALVGFPFSAGYFSKDAIIEAAYASTRAGSVYAYLLTTIAVGLTSFYSFRQVFLTFFGKPRWQAHGHDHDEAKGGAHGHDPHEAERHDHASFEPHEAPKIMIVPLYVLALGAIFAGLLFKGSFIGAGQAAFWKGALYYGPNNHILETMEEVPFFVKAAPMVMLLGGFLIAWYGYIRDTAAPSRWAKGNPILYQFLWHKWYFDELYDALFVKPAFRLGRLLWRGGDVGVIDRFGPDGVTAAVVVVTKQTVKLQTGYVYHYAFAMLIGVAFLITYYLVGGAH